MCKQKGRKLDEFGRFVNEPTEQGECLICNKNLQMKRPPSSARANGTTTYRGFCQTCISSKDDMDSTVRGQRDVYRKHKKDNCEECGFVPKHKCQLDVDHIDENHNNNDPSNLKTLCANCHRLKSWNHKNISVTERREMVEEYFKEQEEFKRSLEKTIRFRRSLKGIQYSLYLHPDTSEDDVMKELNKQILNGTAIGQLRRKKP